MPLYTPTSVGTFTPSLTFATPGDLSIAYSTQTGRYARVGNIVTVHVNLITSTFTFTTASGALTLNGLPFAVNATDAAFFVLGQFGNITMANFTQFGIRVGVGATSGIVIGSAQGQATTNVQATNLTSGQITTIRFSGSYVI